MSKTNKKLKRNSDVSSKKEESSKLFAVAITDEAQDEDSEGAPFPVGTIRKGCWLNIFEKLKDEDQLTFSRTCPQWHEMVAPKRTKLFFLEEAVPLLLEDEESMDVLLQFRHLCKDWTKGLDHQLASAPSHLSFNMEMFGDGSSLEPIHNCFAFPGDIEAFMEVMNSHKGNPFLSRSIQLGIHDVILAEPNVMTTFYKNYWTLANSLLNRFGEHVHYATIFLIKSHHLGLDCVANFRSILLHLPNLKALKIWGNMGIADDEFIRNFFMKNPLPQLRNLELVTFCGVDGAAIDAVVNSCCVATKIKRLTLIARFDQSPPEVVYSFSNLEVLGGFCSIEDLERFSKLGRKPPLRELSIELVSERTIEFERLFTALEAFGGTLLHLELGSGIFVPNSLGRVFNLPHLKSLTFHRYAGSFDKLLQFKKLERLQVDAVEFVMKDRILDGGLDDVTDIYGCMERLYDSNIWTLMPMLNQFEFRNVVYERGFLEKGGWKSIKNKIENAS